MHYKVACDLQCLFYLSKEENWSVFLFWFSFFDFNIFLSITYNVDTVHWLFLIFFMWTLRTLFYDLKLLIQHAWTIRTKRTALCRSCCNSKNCSTNKNIVILTIILVVRLTLYKNEQQSLIVQSKMCLFLVYLFFFTFFLNYDLAGNDIFSK